VLLIAVLAVMSASPAAAQSDDWKISIYPVLAWVPTSIDVDVNVPPISGGGGEGPAFGGKILDKRLDGAFFGGLSAAKGIWRVDADGLWAGFGGDRPDRPVLTVDVDAIYGHGSLGVKIAPNFYATAGIRRMATKYDIELDGREFERKPGLWDPLIGVGWHTGGDTVEWHATFEGGGFGVGSDVDISSAIRLDWKPTTHFGITAGYSLLYFKLSDTVADRTFTAKQTLHGPTVGIGLYF
jgi:hypothetical protein